MNVHGLHCMLRVGAGPVSLRRQAAGCEHKHICQAGCKLGAGPKGFICNVTPAELIALYAEGRRPYRFVSAQGPC